MAAVLVALSMACDGPSIRSSPRDRGSDSRAEKSRTEAKVHFAVMGDYGVGSEAQREVTQTMCAMRHFQRFNHVVTTGDNVYPSGRRADFKAHFFEPNQCLLDNGVRFRVALGDDDVLTGRSTPEVTHPVFGMQGRYYSWRLKTVAFVMVDATNLDPVQVAWITDELRRLQGTRWTVLALHEPIYSVLARRNPSDRRRRELLGAPIADLGVDLVVAGDEHNLQIAVHSGVTHVVTGGGGARLHGCPQELPEPIMECERAHHFLVVTAGRRSMKVEAITLGGRRLTETIVRPNK